MGLLKYEAPADPRLFDSPRQREHEVLGCVLRDADGNVLASLWGVSDPDSAYQRVVEAEIAAEAIHNERQLNRVCAVRVTQTITSNTVKLCRAGVCSGTIPF